FLLSTFTSSARRSSSHERTRASHLWASSRRASLSGRWSRVAGCTSADGQLLRLHFTAHGADSNFFHSYECDFLLPSFSGGNCQFKDIRSDDSVASSTNASATAARCTGNNP